ncbi:M20 family metallo-hydrolase, partial [Thermovenabulum sp.]|uniref:M20 family metallo-hydrolase n=1 Tax=Thermovenabulum sp. TaxID=3100335 RepID=UPI003C7A809C
MLYSNIERIKRDIENLARFTSTPGQGVTRFTYTGEHKKAMDYIVEEMKKAGLKVRVDSFGNIFGRREGKKNLPPIMVGSHIDTVKNGGAFDGQAGIVAGLELSRVLKEKDLKLDAPLEIVALIEEEGGRFGGGLMGSRALAGLFEEELYNLRDEEGIILFDAMKYFGLSPEKHEEARLSKGSIACFIELHVEQGPVLEKENKDAGIVEAIVGIAQYNVTIRGRADHAGTTPMNMRLDALLKASEVIQNINRWARQKDDYTVATVGKIKALPGASNIVPKEVEFSVDIRSINESSMKDIAMKIEDNLREMNGEGFETKLTNLLYVKPVFMDEKIRSVLNKTAKELELSTKDMVSGAGHDAMILSNICPVGMIFVPSHRGRSHCPEEFTSFD